MLFEQDLTHANIQNITLEDTDKVDLEESYKLFINEVLKYLKDGISEEDAILFMALLFQSKNHGDTLPTSAHLLKDKISNFEELYKNFTHISNPRSAYFSNTYGNVKEATFLAAYVCYVAFIEKYQYLLDDNKNISPYMEYLFCNPTKYQYNYTRGLGSKLYYELKINLKDQPWRIKNIVGYFRTTILDILSNFETEVLKKLNEVNYTTSIVWNKATEEDFLKKIFSIGMFTYNIGKTGLSALYRNNSTYTGLITKHLKDNNDLLKFFLEKIFLYPSPKNTAKYKELFMLKDTHDGFFTENKISSSEFCTYLKLRGHPINTKTARLIASFAGVFDDPLGFDYYLTKFLYSNREESRGKLLIDEIKRAIDVCKEQNRLIEQQKQREIDLKVSVFQHLVDLAREIRTRDKIEKFFFMKNREDLLNEQFSRDEKV